MSPEGHRLRTDPPAGVFIQVPSPVDRRCYSFSFERRDLQNRLVMIGYNKQWGIVEIKLDSSLQKTIDALARAIQEGRYLVVFSGAGISTESGIPDFRGPQGIWKKMRPIELSEFLQNPSARKEYWRRKIEGYPQIRDAQPNESHRAPARLYDSGFLKTVITQNIDSVW